MSDSTENDVEALARIIRPWTLCDDGHGFDHGSERAARAVLAAGYTRGCQHDPRYSREECVACGGQVSWCDKCGANLCGCLTLEGGAQ